MLFELLFCFCLSVFISEILSFDRVFYTRLVLFFLILSTVNIVIITRNLIELPQSLIIGFILSNIPLTVAWFGFRVHLSNSITLTLINLIDKNSLSKASLLELYDVKAHLRNRVEELSKGGYLDENGFLTQTKKSKYVVSLIKFLRL